MDVHQLVFMVGRGGAAEHLGDDHVGGVLPVGIEADAMGVELGQIGSHQSLAHGLRLERPRGFDGRREHDG